MYQLVLSPTLSIPSSIGGPESPFFAVESSLEYINADDVKTFCVYLMNKMWLDLFKRRSYFNPLDRFSSYFLLDEGVGF